MPLALQLDIEDRQVLICGVIAIVCTSAIAYLYLRPHKDTSPKLDASNGLRVKFRSHFRPNPAEDSKWTARRELEFYKELFFKLQNLEDFPDTKPLGRQTFLTLLSQALDDYVKAPSSSSILSIKDFDEKQLARFLDREQDNVTSQYHEYINRRKLGGPRELFENKHKAEERLREMAPLKLVDGAWLGHFNKITMPFALRSIVKQAWQVFTEELGNGNAEQHHVKIFEDLLGAFEPDLPSPTTKAILHPRYRLGNLKYWRAAVAQLLISLFPHEFVPEILGFNMHFEALQLDTMQAAKELPELHLNPYYFLLHVSIDNSHSGHAAMAMTSVVDYIQHLAETEGEVAAEVGWKRVQAGYIFSEWVIKKGNQPTNILPELNADSNVGLESRVLAIFRSKLQAAHRLHCGSRVKIGDRLLADWLDPEAFLVEGWQQEFMQCLSSCKPWIYPGDSQKSRLVQELRWGGRMYGSFTKGEVETLELWIDSMVHNRVPSYYSFIEPAPRSRSLCKEPDTHKVNDLNISSLLPLWFAQCCLLESFLYAPGRTTDTTGCAIVRFLRFQSGFETEHPIVTGKDEYYNTTENGGLVDFGLEMLRRVSPLPAPQDLNSLLSRWPCEFAMTMLKLASSPMQNFGVLLGMSMAFLELQETVSEFSNPHLLCPKSSERLAALVRKQYQCLQICLQQIPAGDGRHADYQRGYGMAKAEIDKCF
ncbi:hypothetical protein ASPVEDRAFT_121146 [Aspergillus versicolor CBS 583.65]|uniref:Uncharacterized protein n=1 Tax=Aspergillus versicolor CBS 583.65 TaxID=1036611 RepID=A0A1L9P599_ASPVE|nr:uncharacterized protein ASPVEDRAFT_121146 [Aspergillus versicolor CBS 583.65]OJI96678.1 hypothetical protein ASPVEDRAFT_121146 [Aspergillus versicolor CBS 583.65]